MSIKGGAGRALRAFVFQNSLLTLGPSGLLWPGGGAGPALPARNLLPLFTPFGKDRGTRWDEGTA